VNMFDARKTGMIVLPYGGKNYDDTLSRFHTIPACHGQTDGLAIAPVERALSCWHNFYLFLSWSYSPDVSTIVISH